MIYILIFGILLLVFGFQRRHAFKRAHMQELDEQMRTGAYDPGLTIAQMHGRSSGKGDGTLLVILGCIVLCGFFVALGDSGRTGDVGTTWPPGDSSQR